MDSPLNGNSVLNEGVISLLNFNPRGSVDEVTINSPRSLEAMRRLGLKEKDLKVIKRQDIVKMGIPPDLAGSETVYIELKLETCEKRRQLRVAAAIRERATITEKKGSLSTIGSFTLQQLDRLNKSLDSPVNEASSYSFVLGKVQHSLSRSRIDPDFTVEPSESFSLKRQNSEELRRLRELRMDEAQRRRMNDLRERVARFQAQEKMRESMMERSRDKKEREMKEKEEGRTKKSAVLKQKLEEVFMKRQELSGVLKRRINERNEKVRSLKVEKQRRHREQAEVSREIFEEKMANIKLMERSVREERMRSYREKERSIEEKQKRVERDRLDEQERRRTFSEQRMSAVKSAKKEIHNEWERFNKSYWDELMREEVEREEALKERMALQDVKRKLEVERQEKIRAQWREQEYLAAQERQVMLKKSEDDLREKEERRKKWLEEMKKRAILERIYEEEAMENLERRERVRADKNQQLLFKFEKAKERVEVIQREKSGLANEPSVVLKHTLTNSSGSRSPLRPRPVKMLGTDDSQTFKLSGSISLTPQTKPSSLHKLVFFHPKAPEHKSSFTSPSPKKKLIRGHHKVSSLIQLNNKDTLQKAYGLVDKEDAQKEQRLKEFVALVKKETRKANLSSPGEEELRLSIETMLKKARETDVLEDKIRRFRNNLELYQK